MPYRARFLAIGLFFSSLTSNQIIAAVMSVTGILFFAIFYAEPTHEPKNAVVGTTSCPVEPYILYRFVVREREWRDHPKFYLFRFPPQSLVFLTVKVLESRAGGRHPGLCYPAPLG